MPQNTFTGSAREDRAGHLTTVPDKAAVRGAPRRLQSDFPVHVLPDQLQTVVRGFGAHMNVPADLVMAPLLAYASAAVGTTRVIRTRYGPEPLPIYIASVCPPGSGKTEPAARLGKPFADMQKDMTRDYNEELADHIALMKTYRVQQAVWDAGYKKHLVNAGDPKKYDSPPVEPDEPQLRKSVVTNFTMEALGRDLAANWRGLMIRIDELSGLLGSLNMYRGGKGNDRQQWLSLWSCEAQVVSRITREMTNLDRPFVSVFGTIQPDMLGEIADDQGRQDGFLDRWLFVYPAPPPLAMPGDWVAGSAHAWDEIVSKLFALQPDEQYDPHVDKKIQVPREMTLDTPAQAVWYAYFADLAAETNAMSEMNRLRGPHVKLSRYWVRLAALVHLLRWASGVDVNPDLVDKKSASDAGVLLDYFRVQTKRVYAALALGPMDELARQTMRAVRRGHDTVRLLQKNGPAKLRVSSADCEDALESLLLRGYLRRDGEQYVPLDG